MPDLHVHVRTSRRRREPTYAMQGGAKVHVLAMIRSSSEGWVIHRGACGAELHGEEYLARLVPEADRCQAPACRRQWPANLRAVG